MSNALTTRGATALATQADIDPFAAAGEEMGGSSATYLKFNGNTGEFTYGQDGEELPEGTQLAVNMMAFRRGWICWKDEEVADEVMVKVLDGRPPLKHELHDHGPYTPKPEGQTQDGWSEQSAIEFRSIEDGTTFTFKTSSKSGIRALGSLSTAFSKQYKHNPGKVAIIELGSESWTPKEKKWGKKYSPNLKIVGWADEAELAAGLEGGENPSDYDGGADETPAEAPAPAPAAEERKAPATNARTRRF